MTGLIIQEIIKSNAAVSALIGNKVYLLEVPEGAVIPYVHIDYLTTPVYSNSGLVHDLGDASISCVASSIEDSITLQLAVREAIELYQGTIFEKKIQYLRINNITPENDLENQIFTQNINATIKFR